MIEPEKHSEPTRLALVGVNGKDLRPPERAARIAIDSNSDEIQCNEFIYETRFDENPVSEFVKQTITGGVDLVVLRTQAAVEKIIAVAHKAGYEQRLIDSLNDIDVVASKAAGGGAAKSGIETQALLEDGPAQTGELAGSAGEPVVVGVKNDHWRQLLVLLDQRMPVLNRTVAIESGVQDVTLAAGLAARGANVIRVDPFAISRSTSPAADDGTRPAASRYLPDTHGLLSRLDRSEIDVIVFLNPSAVCHFVHLVHSFLLESSPDSGTAQQTTFNSVVPARMFTKLRHLLGGVSVIAAGNDTATMVWDRQLAADHEIKSNTIADSGSADSVIHRAVELTKNKNRLKNAAMISTGKTTDASAGFKLDKNAAWYNSPFMKSARGEPTDVTPVWMMRQAGRYMQEYRDVRAKVSFLELCANPQLCSEVMCTAVEKLGVDAAIIFSDLLPILVPMGCELEFVKGDGPVIHNPVRTGTDIDRIRPLENNDELMFVMETVAQTRKDLPAEMPLIGFAGAPFTLASYMIEGGASKNYAHTKTLMYSDPAAWDQLMRHLANSISIYLLGQIRHGAQCLQIFDSWAGCLSVRDYRTFALPYVKKIIDSLPAEIPVINFATGNPALLPMLAETSAAVIGIDWRVNLDDAWQTVGHDRSVQGNLDPTALLTNSQEIRRQAAVVLDQAAGKPGHIFNLGHGILPQTPVENAIALVDIVHELSSK